MTGKVSSIPTVHLSAGHDVLSCDFHAAEHFPIIAANAVLLLSEATGSEERNSPLQPENAH